MLRLAHRKLRHFHIFDSERHRRANSSISITIMPNCSAWRCHHKTEQKYIDPRTNKKVTFHRFPHRDPKRMKLWLHNMRRKNFYPSHTALLCSLHFEESCMDRTGQTNRLRDHAVPTIFPNHPAHLQKTTTRPKRVLQRVFPTETSDSEEEPPQPITRMQTADSSSRNSVPETLPTRPAAINTTTGTGTASSDTSTALPGPSKTFPLYFSGPVKVKKSKDSEVSAEASADEHSYSITESRKELKRKLDKSVKLTMQLRTQLKTSHQRARRLKVKVTALTLMIDSLRKREAEILRLFKMDLAKCHDFKAEISNEAD